MRAMKVFPESRGIRAHGAAFAMVTVTVILFTLVCCAGGSLNGTTDAASSPSTASPVPSPDNATTTATPRAPTDLPRCESIFSAAGFAVVAENGLTATPVDPAPGGLSDFDRIIPTLRAIATSNDSVTCSFILPASERGMVISVVRITPADSAAIVAGLAGAGYAALASGALNAGDSGFTHTVSGEYPYTEAHVLSRDTWVSCFDYFGQAATNYALDSTASIASNG